MANPLPLPSSLSSVAVAAAAMSKAAEKHCQAAKLFFTAEDIRWATPEIVARYRAKRLAPYGKTIADLGCGIGFQTFAFAEKFERVVAVEIDKEKIAKAKQNAAVLGFHNIQFIEGDVLDAEIMKQISQQLPKVDIFFCDPERLPTEEERTLDMIKPNITEFVRLYSSLTKKIAIELPPQIKNISLPGEKEYLSVDGKLNRLTLFMGELATAERSAVILPSEARVESKEKSKEKSGLESNEETESIKAESIKAKRLEKYIYEVDPAVAKAGLLAELCSLTKTHLCSLGKTIFLTSEKRINSHLFPHVFQVLATGQFELENIIKLLKKTGAGKVTLRYSVDPREYWKIRMGYEQRLSGSKKVSLFQFGDEAVVGETLG